MSIDNDGSSRRLIITGSGDAYGLNLYDDGASGCGRDFPAARAPGTGIASGEVLTANFATSCMESPPRLFRISRGG